MAARISIEILPNQARLRLSVGSIFWVKASLLGGTPDYDWGVPPPYPWGSFLSRMYHGSWILKRVEAKNGTDPISLFGNHPRGGFHAMRLQEGERRAVAVRCLAGFSGDLRSISTRIKIGPAFWLLREHFFCVMEGPGIVLLYSPSVLEVSDAREFQPTRVVAFDAFRRFRPTAPRPKYRLSQIINIFFSHEVIWQFEGLGSVVAESRMAVGSEKSEGVIQRFLKHLLGFLRV